MLRRLHVKNFKLLRDVEIEFETDKPTVFIGPNASGKSNGNDRTSMGPLLPVRRHGQSALTSVISAVRLFFASPNSIEHFWS